MKGAWIRYSPAELAWIEGHRDWPRAQMHAAFVARFDRPEVTLSHLCALCKRRGWLTGRDGRFQPGHDRSPNKGVKGWNPPGSAKGHFKAGQRRGVAVKLYKPIGTERLSKEGYLERKVNDDMPLQRRWRGVHLIRWEEVNGPLPPGHCLKCLDGDKLNTDPANWICIPRALLPRLVGGNRYAKVVPYDQAPPELRPTLLAIARLEHAAREARQTERNRHHENP